mmetsp:Transcript_2549/g.4604  ORF Transcript_2549/g.4604 Transcript_2549/m.4604 type:complete len:157 (+) Transcript_2549:180-650(+)
MIWFHKCANHLLTRQPTSRTPMLSSFLGGHYWELSRGSLGQYGALDGSIGIPHQWGNLIHMRPAEGDGLGHLVDPIAQNHDDPKELPWFYRKHGIPMQHETRSCRQNQHWTYMLDPSHEEEPPPLFHLPPWHGATGDAHNYPPSKGHVGYLHRGVE